MSPRGAKCKRIKNTGKEFVKKWISSHQNYWKMFSLRIHRTVFNASPATVNRGCSRWNHFICFSDIKHVFTAPRENNKCQHLMSSVMRLWPQQTVWTPCPLCRHSVEVETHFWHSIPDFDLKVASIIVQTAFPAQGYGKGEKNKQLLPGTRWNTNRTGEIRTNTKSGRRI